MTLPFPIPCHPGMKPSVGCCPRWHPAPITARCQPACEVCEDLEAQEAALQGLRSPAQALLIDISLDQRGCHGGKLWGPRQNQTLDALSPDFLRERVRFTPGHSPAITYPSWHVPAYGTVVAAGMTWFRSFWR